MSRFTSTVLDMPRAFGEQPALHGLLLANSSEVVLVPGFCRFSHSSPSLRVVKASCHCRHCRAVVAARNFQTPSERSSRHPPGPGHHAGTGIGGLTDHSQHWACTCSDASGVLPTHRAPHSALVQITCGYGPSKLFK